MGNSHSHHHSHGLHWALLITLGFMFVELSIGLMYGSLALVGDALHMATDSAALIISWAAHWLSHRPTSVRRTYGYVRAEILGALLNGLGMWMLSGILIWEAIERLQTPRSIEADWVIGTATIGIAVNALSAWFLHRGAKENLNFRGAYLHVMSDLIGSVVAVASGLAILWTGNSIFDSVATLLVAGLILFSSWRLVRDSLGILMEFVPSRVDAGKLKVDLGGIAGVEGVHDLHIWSVSSEKLAASVHLIARDTDGALASAVEIFRTRHEIEHTTIQVEHPDRFDRRQCADCG